MTARGQYRRRGGGWVMVLPKRSFYDIINSRAELVCIHYQLLGYDNMRANFRSLGFNKNVFSTNGYYQCNLTSQINSLAFLKVGLWKSCST